MGYEMWVEFKLLHIKVSYLLLVPEVITDIKLERLVWDCGKLQTSLSLMLAI